MRVLLVEDKRSLAAHLSKALESEGLDVTCAYDGVEALAFGKTGKFDLIILDVMLPRMDGFTVLRQLREARLRTQTIMLTARDSMKDIVQGLDDGADDYVTKPFALDVLLARVRAACRRVPECLPTGLEFQDLILLPQTLELKRGERVESLTRTEYALLETLIRRAGTIVSHSSLIEEGWGSDAEVSFDSLYVFIRSLRAKITHPGECELLHTIRGVGYSLRTEA